MVKGMVLLLGGRPVPNPMPNYGGNVAPQAG